MSFPCVSLCFSPCVSLYVFSLYVFSLYVSAVDAYLPTLLNGIAQPPHAFDLINRLKPELEAAMQLAVQQPGTGYPHLLLPFVQNVLHAVLPHVKYFPLEVAHDAFEQVPCPLLLHDQVVPRHERLLDAPVRHHVDEYLQLARLNLLELELDAPEVPSHYPLHVSHALGESESESEGEGEGISSKYNRWLEL